MLQIIVTIVQHVEFRQHKRIHGQAQALRQLNTNVHCVHLHTITLGHKTTEQTINVQYVTKNGITHLVHGQHGQLQVTMQHTAEQEHVQLAHMLRQKATQ